MTVSRVSCGPRESPNRPRSRAMTTPPSSAIASNRSRPPGQVWPPRLTTRTRQRVTMAEDVEKSFWIANTRSCQGSSPAEAERARASQKTDFMEILLLEDRGGPEGENRRGRLAILAPPAACRPVYHL